ncbi:hypothetical protein O1G22_08755 [Streptomyces camelliae]|uniref:Uncharacterized protein n=1 Tax=Streptomyces camelliae TaxID=3004093 RepID=A0ABY7PEV0_9ACTN|nr:hypothetical protein [Streptomyces sp. HUAS 2-6]WBO69159.1 hypothetical protein O1G22_08755 [Streptomyces sp. HUAS 2-6]
MAHTGELPGVTNSSW